MRITKAFLTAAALLISAIPLPAQDGYFPIGVSLVHNSSSPISWSQELLKLQALGVNEIGDWTFPNDTLWLKNVCLPSNGAIKLFTYDGPHYVGYNRYDSTLCWGFIRPAPDGTNWADSLPPDSVWQTIVKAHIDDVISNYIQRPEWAGHYGGLYIMNELKWDEPYWNEQQWNNVYTVVEWACNYWRYNANVPDGLKGRTIYIMASQLLTPELGTTLKTFAERLGSLGIFENDRYPFYPYVPAQYTTNTDSFTMFQQHLQLWVGDGDSCLKYFEKDGTSRKWYALIQAFKAQICTTGTDTTTVKGWKDTWRWPTREEIRAQAWLALSRGAKGIKYYAYQSSPEDLLPGQCAVGTEKYWGLVDENRVPRSSDPAYPTAQPPYIYDWVKELNDTVKIIGPILANLTCKSAFSLNHPDGGSRIIPPDSSYIPRIQSSDTAYHRYDYFELGAFKDSDNNDYFMVVNRYCLPKDTVNVTVTINYKPAAGLPNSYFIVDVLHNSTLTGQLPANRDTSFTVRLLPGGGRLLRIVPFATAPKINNGAVYTNFKFAALTPDANTPLSIDSIQITQKYYAKTQVDTAANPDYISYYWAADTSAWLPYSASAIKYLENSGDNKANIFELQFKVGDGKILTPKYAAQILFNDVPPVNGAITINNNSNFTNSQTVNVKLSGTDVFPGLSQMRFAEAPFDNNSGYVNLIRNGCFDDTTEWVLDNAEFYDGFLHLKGYHTGPGPAQIGSSAKQIIPGSELNAFKGKLVRLCDDIYAHDVISSYKIVDIFYADSLHPNSVRLLEKPIASTPEVVWKASTDTFTLKADTLRPLDRIEISYNIYGIEIPPPPPDDDPLFNTIVVDNIRLEPVELKTGAQPDAIPPVSYYIYDGWDYADTSYGLSYKLSAGDGTKRVFMQLNDLAGNISFCPGWSDTIVLDMTAPMAGITSPVDMSYVNGTISIRGHAWDLHFSNWVLEFKKNNTETWGQLSSGISPIHYKFPQTLCLWNTETISDGLYLLRQTGYDLAGNCKAETVYVYVANNTLPREVITADFALFNSLPVDGTVDADGNIYATDTQDDKIWKFSPEGDSLLCFGYKYTGTDTLGLNHPKGIAVDDSGYIWLTDCYQSKVKKYDGQGNYISAIGQHGNKAGEFNQPTGIVIKDNYIYVADHLNNRVQVFNKAGAFVRQFGDNMLKQPAGIAIRQDEDSYLIYVSDSKNNRIAIFDTLGTMIDSLGAGLDLREPWDICFDCNNNLYIADVYNNRIVQLDAWGNKLLAFGTQGQEAGEFKLPQGLAVSPDGKYVYVIDTHNDRVQRFKMYFDIGTGGPQLAGRRVSHVLPVSFMLGQSFPNPSAFNATINYALPKEATVKLNIYNTLGQKVRTLVQESQMPGYYSINWDSKDDKGKKAATGVYFYRLEAGVHSAIKKMVVIK